MLRRFSINFAIFSIILDGLMVILSLTSMAPLRIALNELSYIKDIPGTIKYPTSIFIIFPLIWMFVLAAFSIYDGKKYFKIVDELSMLTIASVIAAISQAGFLYLTYRTFSRALFLMIIFVTFVLCISWRLVARTYFRLRKETINFSRNFLLLGTGIELTRLEKILRRSIGEKIMHLAQLDLKNFDEFNNETPATCEKTISRIRDYVQKNKVTDVIIAFPRSQTNWIEAISYRLEDLSLGVWVAMDFYDLSFSEMRVESISGIPLLDLRAPALDDYSRIVKRIFDLIFALVFLVVFSPVYLVVALWVFLDDGFPILYHSERIGENGQIFKMIKFRTMVKNAEIAISEVETIDTDGNVIHKKPDDPRILKSGKILRKLSLDEIPQMINVLKGEMSVVGPRPELPRLAESYKHWQRRRLTVPPGITGWWQINGRSDRVMHLHTEDDIYYIENYSIWLDLQIIIRTVWVVLVGRGAY
jgi:exopolysaccharide biosynthesis polyprenyl glycosylphosphotransferase